MNFEDSLEEAAYRAKCRAFLDAHLQKRGPGDVRGYRRGEDGPGVLEEAKVFQRKKWDAGFAGITWPEGVCTCSCVPMSSGMSAGISLRGTACSASALGSP